MLAKTKLKSESPQKTMTWIVIFSMIIFIALLAGVLFFTWHRQTRLAREELLAAKKSAFPGSLEESESESESKDKEPPKNP
jgi:flagellar basal body-associated protein FliL